MKTIFFILALTCAFATAGSPEQARRLSRAYDSNYAKWVSELRTAQTDAIHDMIWKKRPDSTKVGREIWKEIRSDLKQAWVLEPAAWLLENASEYITKPQGRGAKAISPAAQIRNAVMQNHLRSPKVGVYCIGLTHVQDPRAMRLLELVEKSNPDASVRGAAALAQAILHRRLGGDGFGMHLRQGKLRAAIKAPDLTVGKTTTQAILKDELFRMANLSVDTVAPDFRGIEVNQKISSLRDYKGKVTILFFWFSKMPAHEQSLALFRKYQAEYAGQNVNILGVNIDKPSALRNLIADGTATWPSFSDSTKKISNLYRIEKWPYVYVLDKQQKIRYVGEPGAFVKITADQFLKEKVVDPTLKPAGNGQ